MNVLIRTGECITLSPQEAYAMRLIRNERCNYYLNFSRETIPLNVWHIIESLILSDKVYPSIRTIDIRNSNLSINDVRPELQSMIIY